MENQNFTASIEITQSPEKILKAISNVRGWWSENIEGKTDVLGGEFTHRDRYLNVTFKVTHLSPQQIVWDVVKSHCNMLFKNMHEWEGTRIIFEMAEKDDATQIKFTHIGLIPQFECYKVCSKAWSYFIATSLKDFVERGQGDPISSDYASFSTSITVSKSPHKVFEAIGNVRGWWLDNIKGQADKLNDEFKFYVNQRLQFHLRVVEVIPRKSMVWKVLYQSFSSTRKREWIDTTMLFDISSIENETRLCFTHMGLVPTLQCYEACQSAWTKYIHLSLFDFICQGQGQPNKW